MGEIETAIELISNLIPQNTHLTIEENTCSFGDRYIYRLHYASKSSGRTIAMMAKSNNLPIIEDEHLHFILRQLILNEQEIRNEFWRIYMRERNARQDAFLSAGKLSNIRVVDESLKIDRPDSYKGMEGSIT